MNQSRDRAGALELGGHWVPLCIYPSSSKAVSKAEAPQPQHSSCPPPSQAPECRWIKISPGRCHQARLSVGHGAAGQQARRPQSRLQGWRKERNQGKMEEEPLSDRSRQHCPLCSSSVAQEHWGAHDTQSDKLLVQAGRFPRGSSLHTEPQLQLWAAGVRKRKQPDRRLLKVCLPPPGRN